MSTAGRGLLERSAHAPDGCVDGCRIDWLPRCRRAAPCDLVAVGPCARICAEEAAARVPWATARAVTVEEIIDRIDAWRGRPVSIRPLTNGLTNANYRVDVDGQRVRRADPGRVHGAPGHRPRERAPQRPHRGRARHRPRGPPPLPGQRRDGHRVPPRPAHDQRHAPASRACPGGSPRRFARSTAGRGSSGTSTCSVSPSGTGR